MYVAKCCCGNALSVVGHNDLWLGQTSEFCHTALQFFSCTDVIDRAATLLGKSLEKSYLFF